VSYRFRLAAVLKYRERRRDACAAAVKQTLVALQAARERERAQELAVRRLYAALNRRDPALGGGIGLWPQQSRYLAYMRAELRRCRQAVGAAEQEWAAARERLVGANRDCETLVQLARRQRAAWEASQRRRQQRLWDEVAGVRAARQRAAESAESELTRRLAVVAGVPDEGS
jgi:flagellar export protein FliJ